MGMLNPKSKPCSGRGKFAGKGCGRPLPIFSHGLCKSCARKEYVPQNREVSKFSPAGRKKPRYKPTGEKALFDSLYLSRGSRSEISGRPLLPPDDPRFYHQFSHILTKAAFPSLRLNQLNIILCLPGEHEYWEHHRGKVSGDPRWDFVVLLENILKQAYHEKKNNLWLRKE